MRTDARGFRVIPAFATRAGVFSYRRADGSVVRELRHPDDVFDAKSVATLDGASVTDRHPTEWVGPHNVQALETGHAGPGRRDSIYLATDLSVRRADMIGKVDAGEAVEASCGYDCDVVAESGEYEGQRYDQRQTNIVYNHIGLGPKGWGRAGAEVRLRMDSGAAVLEDEPEEQRSDAGSPAGTGESLVKKIRIDGKDYELADDAIALVESLQKRAEKAEGRADTAEVTLAEKTKAVGELQTKLDAASSPAALSAKVAARVALEKGAAKVLGDERLDGKSDHEVRLAVCAKAQPDRKLDGKSEAYVEACFDGIVANAETRNDGLEVLATALAAPTAADSRTDEADNDKRIAEFEKKRQDAHKGGK